MYSISIFYFTFYLFGGCIRTQRTPCLQVWSCSVVCLLWFSPAGLPPEMYAIWEAYPWRFGEPYCLFKTFLTEMTTTHEIKTCSDCGSPTGCHIRTAPFQMSLTDLRLPKARAAFSVYSLNARRGRDFKLGKLHKLIVARPGSPATKE